MGRQIWGDKEIQHAYDLKNKGKKNREIGEEFGVSKDAIASMFSREKIKYQND